METKTRMATRRQFLKVVSSVAATLALQPQWLNAASSAAIKKAIPKTGEQLPVIGMEASRANDVWHDPQLRRQLQQVLQVFLNRGGSLIDTSPLHDNVEQVAGDLLESVTDKEDLFIASKVWAWGREKGIEQMHRSMQHLGVKKIDLMQIRNLRDWREHLGTLRAWKDAGKIRYIGITTSQGRSHATLESILRFEPFDFVQLSYNIAKRKAERHIFPIVQERGIAVLVNQPFQRGVLLNRVRNKRLPAWAAEIDCTTWSQFFLKFVISHPAVTCALPASSRPDHLLDNMAAGYGRMPGSHMRREMLAYFKHA